MFPPSIATPQGCDIQTFYGAGAASATIWNKPTGVSHVYMLLIGAGGTGDGAIGGGSGGVTVWYGAAQHVPQSLIVIPAASGNINSSRVNLRLSNSAAAGTTVLQASSGNGTTPGAAITAPVFAAFGFYNSTAGQDGWGGDASPSSTTFLLGGSSSGGTSTAHYGYRRTAGNLPGYFQMQPIIVGMSGGGTGSGGIGCGGGINGIGGPGMVLIASW
jgi:hypothetical protein